MALAVNTTETFRYERKFVSDVLDQAFCRLLIYNHPCAFREIFNQRFVNNIYFDTPRLSFFFSNIEGQSQRKKIRIRWYGDLMGLIAKPILEFKIKSGYLGKKLSFPLQNFTLRPGFTSDDLEAVFKNSDLPGWVLDEVSNLEPSLVNRYSRKYFLSQDQNFRMTLDQDLHYFSISQWNNTFLNSYSDRTKTILELKYKANMDNMASEVTSNIPLRITKSSKYINGIYKIHHNIPY